MVYLERRIANGKEHYYLVKNIRLKNNKWQKISKYVGSEKPSDEDIENIVFDLENSKRRVLYLEKDQLMTLDRIKRNYKKYLKKLTPNDFIKFEDASLTSFTYNTNSIEGSTLDMQEVGLILNKGISPVEKDLREIYGVTNTREAFNFIKRMKGLTEDNIKKIHFLVMKNTLTQDLGTYRTVPVRIIGSRLKTPFPVEVGGEMRRLVEWYKKNKGMHPFELACTFHIKFEKIHPFRDGNGRVGRLIMNFILLKNRFPLLDIKADKKIAYYKTLEKAQIQRKHKDFVDYAFETYKEDAKQMEWIL